MPLNNLGIATIGGNTTITGSLLVSGSSTTARFSNTLATSVSNVQLGNDAGVNAAGIALFGSQFTPSNQYRANGGYFYSNLAGGLTLHAEGANSMYLATNNTAAITINQSGNSTFANGVKFQNGASYLSYYEEGSWTPQLSAGGTNYTMSGINAGKYIRIGNQVSICGHIQWSAGTSQGQVRISGFPFTSSGVRCAGSIGAVSSGISFSSGYGSWILVNDPGYSFLYIIQLSTTGQGYSHEPPVASSGIIYGFSLTYFIL